MTAQGSKHKPSTVTSHWTALTQQGQRREQSVNKTKGNCSCLGWHLPQCHMILFGAWLKQTNKLRHLETMWVLDNSMELFILLGMELWLCKKTFIGLEMNTEECRHEMTYQLECVLKDFIKKKKKKVCDTRVPKGWWFYGMMVIWRVIYYFGNVWNFHLKCFKGVWSLSPNVEVGYLSWSDSWKLISVQSSASISASLTSE